MILPVLLLLGVIGAARAQQPDTQSATASVEELSAEVAALKAKTSTWDKVLAALPKISGYVQTGYEWSDNSSTFFIKRVRLNLAGAIAPKLDYRVQIEFASPKIVDAYLCYKPFDELNVQLGEYKLPFSIENTDYVPLRYEFIEYPLSLRKLMGFNDLCGLSATGRDMGAQLFGGFFKRDGYSILNYNFGVFNGEGLNVKDKNKSKDIVALHNVNLSIKKGEFVFVLGHSGAGKSTMMAGLAGVLGGDEEGEQEGSLTIDGVDAREARGRVGLVLQDPDSQIILERLGDDAAFGCENLNVPREEIWQRVRESLDMVGLGGLEPDRSTRHLSGGQRQRLALAGVLAMKPGLLLLDEPTANLDPEGVVEVHDAVKKVIEATGQTMVVVEHHIDVWLDLVDRVIVLGRPDASSPTGAVIADGKPDEVFAEMGDVLAAGGAWVPGRAIPDYSPKQESAHDAPVLSTENLSFGRGAALGVGINLDFYPGEVTALMGPNGAGKSTLALTLAGLLKPIAGKVLIADNLKPAHAGREPIDWKSKELLGRIGMVFQEPEHQFAANFVRDEVSIGPKSMGQSQDEAYQTADRMLEQMNLTRFAKANPYTLSGGEKRRLSVASMLAAAPKVLVMDEPTFGQDFSTWNEMVKLIAAIRDQGSCVIMVTHDEALVDALGARRVMFEEAKA